MPYGIRSSVFKLAVHSYGPATCEAGRVISRITRVNYNGKEPMPIVVALSSLGMALALRTALVPRPPLPYAIVALRAVTIWDILRPLSPLDSRAVLEDVDDVCERVDVLGRVAVHDQDVCPLAFLERADLIVYPA